ncbi:MAG: Crp/Fnr family transcriptional regulator [Bacteroidales bacterium]|nr:Crp/Fnr family transcriptional regulator [Bacteroidales bacterium]
MDSCQNCKFRSKLFDKLSEEELETINSNKQTYLVSKGETICVAGEQIKEFVYLVEGLVKLQKVGRDGKAQIVSVARPLDFVGLLTVFSNQDYQYTITALVDSRFCRIDIDVMRQLAAKNGLFALDILKYISKISDEIIRHTYAINSKNLRGRIAMILLDFANKHFESDTFLLPLSRKELAELIDMTPENVIRILSEFRRDNLVYVKGKQIEIIDRKLLEKIRDLG